MKIIKIFLASSEEMREEERKMAPVWVNTLNLELSKFGYFIVLVKWEYLDASMGAAHKEEDYLKELRECELCFVPYKNFFGQYTTQELNLAYKEHQAGHNPKGFYVCFRNSDGISKELKDFRDSFEEAYGKRYISYDNLDDLKDCFINLISQAC